MCMLCKFSVPATPSPFLFPVDVAHPDVWSSFPSYHLSTSQVVLFAHFLIRQSQTLNQTSSAG